MDIELTMHTSLQQLQEEEEKGNIEGIGTGNKYIFSPEKALYRDKETKEYILWDGVSAAYWDREELIEDYPELDEILDEE